MISNPTHKWRRRQQYRGEDGQEDGYPFLHFVRVGSRALNQGKGEDRHNDAVGENIGEDGGRGDDDDEGLRAAKFREDGRFGVRTE